MKRLNNRMKVTLLGGSGFVGTRLISLLQEDVNYQVKNIDLLPSYFFADLTEIGDVCMQAQLDDKLRDTDLVVLLAAVHRDDVTPFSLYYDTNVGGMENTLRAMERNDVKRIVFFSSVAVYGLNKTNPDEEHPADPFNHYGKSKWQAELVLQEWYRTHPDWNINIVRPTVIFGERNRGNVYNLLKQISGGRFVMIGGGENKKSMAYVGNVVSFTKYLIDIQTTGYNVFNYVDKPDFTMNELVGHVEYVLDRHIPAVHIPYALGLLGGYCFDVLSFVTRKKLTISSVRVKKFCATTEFDATKAMGAGFHPPYPLKEGLAATLEFEFGAPRTDDVTFKSE